MNRCSSTLPILEWAPTYNVNTDLRSDLAAGLTIGAMLAPQGMAYALLAGLPLEVGLYASTIPIVLYALFGTSRQLSVGPVAIVSLMMASALGELVEPGTANYLDAAATLALLVGPVHVVFGVGRLGFIVNVLSNSVLVGFTAAAAIIIGFSQVKHILGISIDRQPSFFETVEAVVRHADETNGPTLAVGLASIVVVEAFDLEATGVKVVGDVPDSLPSLGLPTFDASLAGSLLPSAVVASMLVVFARMSRPHVATLGRVPGTTMFRNTERFPEVESTEGIVLFESTPRCRS